MYRKLKKENYLFPLMEFTVENNNFTVNSSGVSEPWLKCFYSKYPQGKNVSEVKTSLTSIYLMELCKNSLLTENVF